MTDLSFLSLHAATPVGEFRPLARSSLERGLREAGAEFEERDGWLVATRVPGEEQHAFVIRDVTHLDLLPDGLEPPETRAGFAGVEILGPGATTLLRRLTDLDLDALPAVGAFAHVRAWIVPAGREAYGLFFPQEYGHYLWEVLVDAARPLGGGPAGAGA